MTSPYCQTLDKVSKKRYLEKIGLINNKDPYTLKKADKCFDVEHFPQVTYMDMVNYLVYGLSAYTEESFKAYKSLEAYNQFTCGWVSDVSSTKIAGMCLVMGKVKHSQRLSEQSLQPWIVATVEGLIKSAHCTCMAGLGEACTHVAALLFYVQNLILRHEEKSVTSVAAYWSQPSRKTVEYLEVENIDFSTPKAKLEPSCKSPKSQRSVPKQTDADLMRLLRELNKVGSNSSIFNVVPPYNHAGPKNDLLLKNLYKEEYLQQSLEDLRSIANDFSMSISLDDVKDIEKKTKIQAKSRQWFEYRSGRITASNMKAACCTKIEKPAISTIKRICYPAKAAFHNKATSWGCSHEKNARADFSQKQKNEHQGFVLSPSGLVINKKFPFLGASPDGLISCDCCGLGCLEVKCPYCIRDSHIDSTLKHACLTIENGHLQLSRKHAYYYQVQDQIFVTDRAYCDFVLWTNNGMHIERIWPDIDFWNEQRARAETLFRMVILPELLGKVYTIPNFQNGLPRNGNRSAKELVKRPHVVHL